jgi:hypothetical protein
MKRVFLAVVMERAFFSAGAARCELFREHGLARHAGSSKPSKLLFKSPPHLCRSPPAASGPRAMLCQHHVTLCQHHVTLCQHHVTMYSASCLPPSPQSYISDRVGTPPETACTHSAAAPHCLYTEKMLYMPHSYQVSRGRPRCSPRGPARPGRVHDHQHLRAQQPLRHGLTCCDMSQLQHNYG